MSWDRITRPKTLGGIDIRKSSLLNAYYMARNKWKILICNNNPYIYASLFFAKYGPKTLRRNSRVYLLHNINVKDAFYLLQSNPSSLSFCLSIKYSHDKNHSWLWKFNCLAKDKIFIWLILNYMVLRVLQNYTKNFAIYILLALYVC